MQIEFKEYNVLDIVSEILGHHRCLISGGNRERIKLLIIKF